jgi:hypothetical protein
VSVPRRVCSDERMSEGIVDGRVVAGTEATACVTHASSVD